MFVSPFLDVHIIDGNNNARLIYDYVYKGEFFRGGGGVQ